MERAHEAFFDPDMLVRIYLFVSLIPFSSYWTLVQSLLYFPDEHKFAIYTPLFLPISVPVVLKLLAEIKKLRGGKKTKDKKVKAE